MIVFLVEETSMYLALQQLAPKILPGWQENTDWKCIPHEGKSDLEQSIPRKLRAWRAPDVHFVVLRDKDSADCLMVKNHLKSLCEQAGRPDTLIRIPCHELDAWFLGDLKAVSKACNKPSIKQMLRKEKFRNPDSIANASDELYKLTGVSGKIDRARRKASHMNPIDNRSHSFNVFLSGLRRIL